MKHLGSYRNTRRTWGFATHDVYTVLAFITIVALTVTIGYVWLTANDRFGTIKPVRPTPKNVAHRFPWPLTGSFLN